MARPQRSRILIWSVLGVLLAGGIGRGGCVEPRSGCCDRQTMFHSPR